MSLDSYTDAELRTELARRDAIHTAAAQQRMGEQRGAGIQRMAACILNWLKEHPDGDPALDPALDQACERACPGFSGGMWLTAEHTARKELREVNRG